VRFTQKSSNSVVPVACQRRDSVGDAINLLFVFSHTKMLHTDRMSVANNKLYTLCFIHRLLCMHACVRVCVCMNSDTWSVCVCVCVGFGV